MSVREEELILNKIAKMQNELERYRGLEKDGLLKVFPCHAGDSVFAICGRQEQRGKEKVYIEYVAEGVVDSFTVGKEGVPQAWVDINGEWSLFDCNSDFGKSVFLTKKEAQKAIENGVEA